MRMLRRILVREFFPFLFLGIVFFALILVMADLFANLWQYLSRDVPIKQTLLISLLYLPRAFSFAIPMGSMFATAFALGNLGSRNELIAVFSIGVSLWRFVIPLLGWAFLLSIAGYFLEDSISIPMMRRREALSNEYLGLVESGNRTRAVAIADEGTTVYYADFYDDIKKTLRKLTVLQLNEEGDFLKRIDAQLATWEETGLWFLEGVRIFEDDGTGEIRQKIHENYREDFIKESPNTFKLDTREIDEMNNAEVRLWIKTQKRTGLPYKSIQSQYYQRYTMALTPFLVVLFAGAMGGRFKRNVLLMSLLSSLGLAVAWYVVRMLTTLLAENGMVSPLAGAVVPFLSFLGLGIGLFKVTRT